MVDCGQCGASNSDGAHFCADCGSALTLTCPRCGGDLPGPVRFCPSCGGQISPTVTEEQRKVVSVLFVDLVGHTARSEGADPEDVREVLRDYYSALKETIERFGGVVEKFIGDAVMAVFGSPVARGDDAERGVRAALMVPSVIEDLNRAKPGSDLRVRVAVNTGEAVVTLDPSSAEGPVLVAGDVVNTAARLQTAAPAGRVLVGEETHRATRRAIRYESLSPVDAKGKKQPVPAWLAIEPITGFAERAARLTFVGRDSELNLLNDIWKHAVSERRPHLVTVLGDLGVGKSRLAAELATLVEDSGGRAFHVRELPYEHSSGYEAFGQLVKEVAGIFESDPAESAHEKLAASLRELGLVDPQLVGLLSVFTGSPEIVAGDRRAVFDAARRYVEALGRQRPTLVVFEDVHWAHPSMLDLIVSLAGRTRDAPVVFLALSRPELLDLSPGWGGGLSASTTIRLEPLSSEHAHTLVSGLVTDLPAEVSRRIETTAGGNPLFIEEMAAWVKEGGGSGPELPTTVRAMIAARLDALPREERQVLFDASIVGKVFWLGALASLRPGNGELEALLDSLENRDLVRIEPESDVEGDREYAFRHTLIRDVAYATLPKGVRRERHEAVARFIEQGAPDAHAVAAILAHHWREAGDAERAVGYLLAAAEQAESGWACAEAVQLYEEALTLLPKDDEARRRAIGMRRAVAKVRHEHSIMDEEQLRSMPNPGAG